MNVIAIHELNVDLNGSYKGCLSGAFYRELDAVNKKMFKTGPMVIYNLMFTDVARHWDEDVINDVGSRMVVTVMGNNIYEPYRRITREEFTAIAVCAMGLQQDTTESSFGDVALTD